MQASARREGIQYAVNAFASCSSVGHQQPHDSLMQDDDRKKHSGAAADEIDAKAFNKRRTPVKAG